MRKHPDIVISKLSIPQINLDISTGFTPRSVGSTPDHQKYLIDDINEPTPCTLLYVKGRTLRAIEVADAIVMTTPIMHGQPIPSDCVVVELTMIREGHKLKDLDYPDKGEGIEKLKDPKGNFILWPHKDIILKLVPHRLFHRRTEGMRVLQLLKIPYAALPNFAPPSQNPPQTIPPPEIAPSTQPLDHHSLVRHSPHTTTPQNPPTEQALQHHSPPCVAISSSLPHTTTPSPQNPSTEQSLQHHSPHVHSPKSHPHTTPPSPQNPPTEQARQHHAPPHVHSQKSPHTTPHSLQNPPTAHAL
jgi:hypothetical protein